MLSRTQRLRANIYYLKRPVRQFMPLLLFVLVVLIAGSICFHHFYHSEDQPNLELTYLRSLYITFNLMFMEHVLPFPDHWVVQVFYFVMPPLALVVILDGFVRFGYHILQRDESGKEWVQAMAKTMSDHVVLCGLGKVGLRILEQLLHLGEEVIVLEKDPQCPALAYARKHGVPVLIGGGREEGILDDLNVARAKSIILATDDDLANLEMAMDARKIKPDVHVVLRMFDKELVAKIRESFNIQLGFSTSELAAPLFATSSSDRTIKNAFYVDETLLVVAQLKIGSDSELIGKPIRALGSNEPIFVLSHGRNGHSSFHPDGETVLEAGDEVTIQTEPQTLKEVHRWNRDAAL